MRRTGLPIFFWGGCGRQSRQGGCFVSLPAPTSVVGWGGVIRFGGVQGRSWQSPSGACRQLGCQTCHPLAVADRLGEPPAPGSQHPGPTGTSGRAAGGSPGCSPTLALPWADASRSCEGFSPQPSTHSIGIPRDLFWGTVPGRASAEDERGGLRRCSPTRGGGVSPGTAK